MVIFCRDGTILYNKLKKVHVLISPSIPPGGENSDVLSMLWPRQCVVVVLARIAQHEILNDMRQLNLCELATSVS